jgi:hypothetical protein
MQDALCGCSYQFDITNAGTWTLDLKTGDGSVVKGDGKVKPDLVIKVGEGDFAQLYDGKLNAQQVCASGELGGGLTCPTECACQGCAAWEASGNGAPAAGLLA